MANTLKDGEVAYIQGSGKKPYELKNTGGVYSCSCPAWRNQSTPIDVRTCKHLKKHLGDEHENARTGKAPAAPRELAVGEAPDKKVKGKTIAEVKGYDVQEVLDRAAKEGRKLRPDEKAKINGAPVLLAHKFEHDKDDPTGWWMSEKLDGVRAYWDGQNFISRQGNVFHAPDWYKQSLPDHPLDGELWMARGKFQQTISVVKRLDGGTQWESIRYMVYDAPHLEGVPFEERMEFLQSNHVLAKGHGYAKALSQEKVRSKTHLLDELKRYVAFGAEGLMIRQPGSLYEVGRSYTLLKVKPVDDDEATVIGYTAGKGRHKGVVGALQVRLKNGIEFDLGTGLTDADRRDPPAIGSTVTFTYIGLTDDGKPKFAAFVAVRDYE
jgi:DNA ligase 1